MRKKMYWGIASLILIIGVVGIFVMLQPESDREPEKKFIVPSEADLKKAREARKPPPDASPNGHWHGDEWHDESHEPIVDNSDQQPNKNVTPILAVEGEVDIMDLPKLPPDIDPDEIPPFYRVGHDGSKHHFSRPLTPEEREVYEKLKSDGSYGNNPARLKASAIIMVRLEKEESGALQFITDGLMDGSITSEKADQYLADFFEMTPGQKGGFK